MKNSATSTNIPVSKSWAEEKAKLKVKFSNLTDADWISDDGRIDKLMSKVRLKLNKSKEEFALIMSGL